jgi:hypothetical protein
VAVVVEVISEGCVAVSVLVMGKATEPIAMPMTSMTTAMAAIVGISVRVTASEISHPMRLLHNCEGS